MKKSMAFTLAEVLIVAGVIGVVAALTIPTLINIISSKAKQAQTDVIETRLLDGINRFSAADDGLSQKYETTYDFLQGLSKHYKMSQICKADEITKCFPYSKINSQDGSKSADVKSLKTIHSFMSGDGTKDYLAPASFISAQGTPFVVAFKKDCVWDMGQAMQSIEDSECIAYLYDKNGAALPNKVGEDLVGHGLIINGFPFTTLGGVKIMEKAFFPSSLTTAQCEAEISKNYGINNCWASADRWAYAMKYCHDKGWHLPSGTESLKLMQGLFKDSNGNTMSGTNFTGYTIDADLAAAIGLKNSDKSDITQNNVNVYLWRSDESSATTGGQRYFTTDYTDTYYHSPAGMRNRTEGQAVCIGN